MPVEKQIAIIFCGAKGLLQNVPVKSIQDFETEYLHFMELHHKSVLTNLREGKLLEKDIEIMEKVTKDISQKYTNY